ADSIVLEMAADGRRYLEYRERRRPCRSAGSLRLWVDNRFGQHVPHQSLRFVRIASGMALLDRQAVRLLGFPHSGSLPLGSAPTLCRMAACLLVSASDVGDTPDLCDRNDCLHPAGDPA